MHFKSWNNQIYKMEEEDKKRNLETLKNYQKKEAKSIKKIFIIIFLIFALVYIVKLLMGFF
jgi:predicted nucleic acid-binding Zn ribbon protein